MKEPQTPYERWQQEQYRNFIPESAPIIGKDDPDRRQKQREAVELAKSINERFNQ
jgi:hypothetical protein